MKYIITNKENKQYTDKASGEQKGYIEATLLSPDEQTYKVSAFRGEFNGIDEIDCELEKNDRGYWRIKKTNYVAKKQDVIGKAMEKKNEFISKAQDNRSESVKVSGTMRDAVLLALKAIEDPTRLKTLEEEVLYWRAWVWEHYDDPITNPIYPN